MLDPWMGQIGCPETLVTNYQSTLRNIPKERGESLKSSLSSCYTSKVLRYVAYEYATGYCSVFPHTYCKLYILPYSTVHRPGSTVDITTGYGLDGDRFPVGSRFTMGTGSFPGIKFGQGVTLAPHPLLVPWSWKSRAIPLLPLWAVRPVQTVSACTRVHFTFNYTVHIQIHY
jgi:hypothetical protein